MNTLMSFLAKWLWHQENRPIWFSEFIQICYTLNWELSNKVENSHAGTSQELFNTTTCFSTGGIGKQVIVQPDFTFPSSPSCLSCCSDIQVLVFYCAVYVVWEGDGGHQLTWRLRRRPNFKAGVPGGLGRLVWGCQDWRCERPTTSSKGITRTEPVSGQQGPGSQTNKSGNPVWGIGRLCF